MKAFRFEPELFVYRPDVVNALGEAGFEWLVDFTAVDVLHDLFGLEVCGIAKEADAQRIEKLLRQMFPAWKFWYHVYYDGEREPGWKVVIHRDPEDDPGAFE